ncbi:phosphoribosylformylglycinamidine synthase subunit PurL [Iodidimonas nitroreducens]|uniref:Phosphoribosylformylglycinamidine synthase subunit PurL n=1 Tax=Iodidimonas nitroreducens TaxID=1236968 RepID=A0A5A7NAT2_9PROT|nr:phosphoribosylformylglycinamidine synthase subunit PurL [Iodidimonas nitroreducens]GAK33076.1 phosphoribosylformylglycinamidine synthase 2 [alpha proteobacterium Q-1]GER05503.1 phosphoribosylformylglycinamidine synthase subunit PurL [Iodidimonas nitroreducens]
MTHSAPPSNHNDQPPITPQMIKDHGLNKEEYERVLKALGRAPNLTELGIYSVMWSEHCSYKSSRLHLKKLPTTAPWVICGPGENAGVVDIGDGQAAIFKMESHNHPSFIEPYQGAATGVGGILRDVFTMGARPVANMNALRFGAPDHPKTRHLLAGVVAGIGGYGNCVGVPTVGGETNFHPSYNGNILVNAMTVGVAEQDKIFYSAAAGVGNSVVYVGSKTGRDGIHGATMASAEFSEDTEEKRPTVQVGDPFTEKLLIEACLELMATDAIIAIQDMGAAGLTSSSVEMASKGGVGFRLDLSKVPCRESGMTPYEMMLSESQERMLMVLKPGREAEAEAIFHKWELDFAIIGTITDTGRLTLVFEGETVADIPVDSLTEDAPIYDRPHVETAKRASLAADECPPPADYGQALLALMGGPHGASRRWIWEQYDHMVMGDTVQRPGGDAAVVRVHGTNKALAITTDCTPRYVAADPRMGACQAVAEAFRNLSAVGAKPLAITDCLNFGNPERPQIMGQIVGAIEGMAKACRALDMPVVSGNVSLYNETNGTGILPTPAVGAIGLINDASHIATLALKRADDQLILIGETKGHLGASLYLWQFHGQEIGAPPPVDLGAERRNGDFVRSLIESGLIDTVHDLSDGGLAVALCTMALAGHIGVSVDLKALSEAELPPHAALFGEDQGRMLLAVPPDLAPDILARAKKSGVPARIIGQCGGDRIALSGLCDLPLDDLRTAHEGWMPDLMAQNLTAES